VNLPSENGGFQVIESRPRFAPDGQSAYFGTAILASDALDQYSYLYAVSTGGAVSPPSPPPANQAPSISVSHIADGTNGWNRRAPAALLIAARDPDDGLAGPPKCTDRLNGAAAITLTVRGTSSPYAAAVSTNGTHLVSCQVKDVAGHVATASNTVKVDTTPPTISVTHRLVSTGYRVTVLASDATSGLSKAPVCTDNGNPLRLTVGASSWTATVTTRGRHSINCSVSNSAGSRSSALDSVLI
jgi:hypothetical protein